MSDPQQPQDPDAPPDTPRDALPPPAPAPPAYPVPGPGAPLAQPYPGAPLQPQTFNPAGAPPPDAPDGRPRILAIVALVLAVVGTVMAFIPFVTWVSGIVLLAAFIVSLVALISKKQGGKGFSIAALALSVVGWIVSIVMAIASFGLIAGVARDSLRDDRGPVATEAPGEEAEAPTRDDAAGAREELVVVESAFGRTSYDPSTWWYVVVLENPNEDHIFELANVDVEAVDAEGTILDTSSSYLTILSGRTAITGLLLSVGQGEVAALDVRGPFASSAVGSPADETGEFAIEMLTATSDDYSTSVTGRLSGTFDTEQEFVNIVVIARAADGGIIGAETAYIERLPVDGKVQFEAWFYDELPADATFEAFASL